MADLDDEIAAARARVAELEARRGSASPGGGVAPSEAEVAGRLRTAKGCMAAALFLPMAGCVVWLAVRSPEDDPEKRVRDRNFEARMLVEAHLKDPDSAKFDDVYVQNDSAVCGRVNARNSFGGYVGARRFVVRPNNTVALDEAGEGGGEAFTLEWLTFCTPRDGD